MKVSQIFLLEVRGQRLESCGDSSSGFGLPVSVPLDALDSQVESSLGQWEESPSVPL